eukprot:1113536-Heterocapsa_arctica.AAC.1
MARQLPHRVVADVLGRKTRMHERILAGPRSRCPRGTRGRLRGVHVHVDVQVGEPSDQGFFGSRKAR